MEAGAIRMLPSGEAAHVKVTRHKLDCRVTKIVYSCPSSDFEKGLEDNNRV